MIVTRFAPSPTGFLHIGGVRTAIFNWLYARKNRGKFFLRIEDTDLERSTPEAVSAILSGLKWMGLDWDEEVVYQRRRADLHRKLAYTLLERGAAYECYVSQEELRQFREQNPHTKFISPWRDAAGGSSKPADLSPVIRLRAETTGSSVVNDRIYGKIEVQNEELDDMVLLRADGTPTYMLAVVADDHDMGVTHVIRGDDHMTNTFRQNQIYTAMGWKCPTYAHIPLIHGPDGAKLSKRHGALGIEAYAQMGYLPEAMFSYLLRLGWSHGNDEIITKEDALKWFDINDINKSPARIDFDKMRNVNAHYMKKLSFDEIIAYLPVELVSSIDLESLRRAMPLFLDRATTLKDMIALVNLILAPSIPLDDKSANLLSNIQNISILTDLYDTLQQVDVNQWCYEEISKALVAYYAKTGRKQSEVMQLLRASVLGTFNSPGIIEMMSALGQNTVLKRINILVNRA